MPKKVQAHQHRELIEFMSEEMSDVNDVRNGLGPYRLDATDDIHRFFDCVNYERCLSFAAKYQWDSFSCHGCRKTAGKECTD